ncbi:MAG: diacylglycerol kinase [Candidatus Niyogibacteria bacterium]|nr:diacylglycerol kinase [Candidatus Niyogibacteria bacterium]
MFGDYSYLAYTLLFCVPLIAYLWLRNDFFHILKKRAFAILCGTLIWTTIGPHLWYIAMHVENLQSWKYEKAISARLFGYIYIEDIVWWFCFVFLLSSFWAVSTHFEDKGRDIVWEEICGLVKSFRCAFRGLCVFCSERNLIIETSIAIATIIGGIFFRITITEWSSVLLWIAVVIGFEIRNTALERFITRVHPAKSEDIRDIKDMSAGSVLLPSILALIIGLCIFGPKIYARF